MISADAFPGPREDFVNATLRLLGCVLAALLVVTFASSASFADEPAPPGDDSSTGESTEPEGDTEDAGGSAVEGDTPLPEVASDVGNGNGAITESGGPVGQPAVEVEDGADVRIIKNGGISVAGAEVIDGDPVVGEITGVLTSKARESGGVAYEVRRFTAPTTFISSLSTIHVNVLVDGEQDAASGAADDDSVSSATAALPETGASRNLKPVLAAGLYFTIAGLIVVGATRPYEIYVPVPRARRPRVNWE
jgi:hypothetical protein